MRPNDPFADLIRSLEENLQEGGGGYEPPDDVAEERPRGSMRRWLWILIPFLIFIFFNEIIGLLADWYWYDSVGYTSIFVKRLVARVALFVAGALIFWLFLALNVWLARRLQPDGLRGSPLEEILSSFGLRVTQAVLLGGAAIAILMGLMAAGNWEQLLLFVNRVPFNVTDPLFNRDIGFFVFVLPVWQALHSWLMFGLIVVLAATALVGGVGWRGWYVRRPALLQLAILGALILLLVAWQYRINTLELVYGTRGVVFGAGYTDTNAQRPAYNLLFVITLIAAVLLVVAVFARGSWRYMLGLLVVWVVVAVVAGNVYPGLVQRFQVSPNELNLEGPYIAYNIQYTRQAYDLDAVETREYVATENVSIESLLAEADTLANVRLWDYRPLLETYNQIQALRQYYLFNDVDVDRYTIDGELKQTMVAVRELVPEQLSQDAQTWVNRRLVYTHGFGASASPAAFVTPDGLPEFFLKDIPPQGVISVTVPQVYFGELADDYVIGRTNEPEFDYPRGDGNATNHFSAETGIEMSWPARLLFAIRLADINMLLNQDIQPASQLLWRRNVEERIRLVAPFLHYDRDPYAVIGSDGAIYWVIDAYTASNRYPYSEPLGDINYMRNAVKVVVNAYDGTMRFYLVDPTEPIIADYASIFPELFLPITEMPADLLQHIRYPEDLFTVQAETFRTYHMTDVTEFYNREDLWSWPQELFGDETVAIEPYYVLMQLPGENTLEFVQILPYTPANRENMIAWMVAKSAPEQYGEKTVFEFGKDTLFFGPKQVEARINQDPNISAQLTLWNQQGSNVIRGNLLVIPAANTLLYVEPLYLQAAAGRIPELKRVIVATNERVEMGANLGLALARLFGDEVLADAGLIELATYAGAVPLEVAVQEAEQEAIQAAPQDLAGGGTIPELIAAANAHFVQAQELAQRGDWAGYGEEIDALAAVLGQLVTLTGEPAPAVAGEVAPTATPTP